MIKKSNIHHFLHMIYQQFLDDKKTYLYYNIFLFDVKKYKHH